jgi:hypothetical protein
MWGWERVIYNRKAEKTKKRLRGQYQKLTQEIDLKSPYVFLPLHYQPEQTTSPEGEIFVNQMLVVDLLIKTLPSDWMLYIKEHPIQFMPFYKGHLGRSMTFYDDLVSYPNVRLVSLSLSPFDLIDHSKAVATVTGTVGWEAVNRGKPALVFGHAWYKGCEGVFYTPTMQSCREAIAAIKEGYYIRKEKVDLFVRTMEQVCIRAYATKEASDISYEQNVQAITQAFRYLYGKKDEIN